MSSSEQELNRDEAVVTDEITEEQLDDRRTRLAELHQEIAEQEAERARQLAAANNEVVAAQLDTEIVKLESRLAQAKAETKAAAETSTVGPLAAAKAEMDRAQVLADAPPAALVDTNAENQPEGTTGATVAEEVGSVEEAERVSYESAVERSSFTEPTYTPEASTVESNPDVTTTDDATPGA